MQIVTEKKNVALSGEVKSREFTMKAGAHLMSVLSGLYNNPVDACVREYLTNMYDAYAPLLKAGTKIIPPILRVPTTMSPTLEFEDFGVGMDFDMVWKVYAEYGNSTKSDSNDEVGGFGLGSKTAFCYNEGAPWNIVTTKNGITNRFMAFVNEKGVPTLTHLSQTTTNAPNGTKVSIPMRSADIQEAQEAARSYIPYFPMALKVEGMADVPTQIAYILSGEGWGVRQSRGRYHGVDLRVVMGNVPYQVSLGQLISWQDIRKEEMLLFADTNNLDLHVPIGDVDIVPSRDSLKITDRTKKAVREAIRKMYVDLPDAIRRHTSNCKTTWERIVEADKIMEQVELPTALRGTLESSLAIKVPQGVKATRYSIMTSDIATPQVFEDETEFTFSARKRDTTLTSLVIVNDTKKGAASVARNYIREHFVNKGYSGGSARYGHTPCKVYVVTLPADMSVDDFTKKLEGFDNVKLLSTIPVKVNNVGQTKKSSLQVYQWEYYRYQPNASVDPNKTKYYYLPLVKPSGTSRFELAGGSRKYEGLTKIAQAVKMSFDKVYGIREKDVAALPPEWENFEDALAKEVLDFIPKNQKVLASISNKEGENYINFFTSVAPKHINQKLREEIKAAKVSAKTHDGLRSLVALDNDLFTGGNTKKIKTAMEQVKADNDLEQKAKQFIEGQSPAVTFAYKLWAATDPYYRGGLQNTRGGLQNTLTTLLEKEFTEGA